MTSGRIPPTDPYVYDDAAYVLGALSDDERQAFEAHLLSCADCRARVAEVQNVPALLAGLSPGDLADEPVPDTLLPGLLRRAGKRRHREHWVLAGLAAVAVALLVALAVVVWPSNSAGTPSHARPFVALGQTPVRATATLVAKDWGTQVDVHCSYAEGVPRPLPYKLRVYDAEGDAETIGSWTVPVGHDMNYSTGTRYLLGQITKLQILRTDGTPVLELDT